MILDIPYIPCFVSNKYILEDKIGVTEAYVYSVTAIRNRPMLFNVHTIDGALYSRLPLWALSYKHPIIEPLNKKQIDPWGVIGDKCQVIQHAYLKGYQPSIIKHPKIGTHYLMSFDWHDGGFSEDPAQSKTMHLFALSNGQFGMFPNNELIFKDNHFTNDDPPPKYKRNKRYFCANG